MFQRLSRQTKKTAAKQDGGKRRELKSLPASELQAITGGAAGSFSWRAFNPQPEPPRVRLPSLYGF